MSLIRATALSIPLADESVDLSLTSPPYFALRSYQDGGEHYDGQLGSEPTPEDFLRGQWAVADEVWRVLKPGGSAWWNYGDKYAGGGGHNNQGIGRHGTGASTLRASRPDVEKRKALAEQIKASRRNAPDRYNQSADVRNKSLMGLPWRFFLGLICPERYREPIDPSWTCWHDDGPGPCITCRRKTLHPQWVGRAEVCWSKPNGLPESVTDRVRRSHEQWFHVTKSERYFAALDEIREPHAEESLRRAQPHRAPSGVAHQSSSMPQSQVLPEQAHDPLGKLPGSVWEIPSEPLTVPEDIGVDHFAAFPQEWPRRIILGWSPSGYCTVCGEPRRPVVEKKLKLDHVQRRTTSGLRDASEPDSNGRGINAAGPTPNGSTEATITGYACACPEPTAPTRPAVVLDPFGGTGTTAMVARALGRYPVHIDLSRDYLRLARWRIYESGHWRKTIERTNRGPGGNVPELRTETDVLERPSLFDVEPS